MLDKNTMVKVSNRNRGSVGYALPELHIRRNFASGETKEISVGELEALSMIPGGERMIYSSFLIDNKEAISQIINREPEPEYWLTAEKIPTWMKQCSIEEFMDALEFAPDGVKELIKKVAVEMPLNDNEKRDAVKDILHFDITKAIAIKKDAADNDAAPQVAGRRTNAATITGMDNKYKVVSRGK